MQRRCFLRLAVNAAAGAMVPQPRALSQPPTGLSLSLANVPFPPGSRIHGSAISLVGNPGLSSAPKWPPRERIEMLWEKQFGVPGERFQWVIESQPYAEGELLRLLPAQRHRLRIMNATGERHTLHLLKHSLQLARVGQTPVTGPLRSAITLERYAVVDADIVVSVAGAPYSGVFSAV